MRRRTLLAAGSAALLAAPAIAQDRRGRLLRVVPRGGLGSLDPVQTTGSAVCAHGSYVFDTLYAPGPDLRPRPQMAAGHTVYNDGRTWRLFLREGLTFHDGTPVRAIDCAISLRRWCHALSPFGQMLAKVVGTWGARDDRTIELTLSRRAAADRARHGPSRDDGSRNDPARKIRGAHGLPPHHHRYYPRTVPVPVERPAGVKAWNIAIRGWTPKDSRGA